MVAIWASSVAAAHTARNEWGNPGTVYIVSRAVAAGELLSSDDVRAVEFPAPLIPRDALRTVGSEPLRTRLDLLPGDLLRERDLDGTGDALGEGLRALAIPKTPLLPELGLGDGVDLFLGASGYTEVDSVTVEGRVHQVLADAVVIAVDAAVAPEVAAALADGRVIVAAA